MLEYCEEVWQLNFKVSQETRIAWCQHGVWLKNKGDIDQWSLSGANPTLGSEQTKVVVTAMGTAV